MAVIELARADDGNEEENVGLAFGLVAAAGLSTTFGAAMVFFDCFFSQHNFIVLGGALGFAGGVMFYVSMVEIFQKALDEFEDCDCLWADAEDEEKSHSAAYVMSTVCFFSGVIIIYGLDFVVHFIFERSGHGHSHMNLGDHEKTSTSGKPINMEETNSTTHPQECTKNIAESFPNMLDRDQIEKGHTHHHHQKNSIMHGRYLRSQSAPVDLNKPLELLIKPPSPSAIKSPMQSEVQNIDVESETDSVDVNQMKLEKMGVLTAIAIGLHNFPEGLATFVATLSDPKVGAALAVAIAIHNIPEGLCVAVPIYYSSGSRWKGFWIAFWSGISELVGAALGYAFLRTVLGSAAYGVLFGVVAGMMVTIVLKELIPTAHRYDPEDKYVTKCVFVGAAIMALSLVLFVI